MIFNFPCFDALQIILISCAVHVCTHYNSMDIPQPVKVIIHMQTTECIFEMSNATSDLCDPDNQQLHVESNNANWYLISQNAGWFVACGCTISGVRVWVRVIINWDHFQSNGNNNRCSIILKLWTMDALEVYHFGLALDAFIWYVL